MTPEDDIIHTQFGPVSRSAIIAAGLKPPTIPAPGPEGVLVPPAGPPPGWVPEMPSNEMEHGSASLSPQKMGQNTEKKRLQGFVGGALPGAEFDKSRAMGGFNEPVSGALLKPTLKAVTTATPAPSAAGAASVGPKLPGLNLEGYGRVRKEAAEASEKEAQAIQKGADVARQSAAEQFGIEQGKLAALENQEQKRMVIEQRAQQLHGEQIQKAEGLRDELRKIPTDVDPKRFWREQGNGNRITAAIGIFLGGLGRGPNDALRIVENAVERDVQAQQANIQNARALKLDEMEAQRNIYAANLAALGDEREAALATKAALYERVEAQLAATAAKYADPAIQAEADRAVAQLGQKRAQTEKEFIGLSNQNALAKANHDINRAQLAAQQQSAAAQAQAAKVAGAGKMDEANRERYVPGLGLALDKDAAKKARELSGNYESVKGDLKALQEWRKKYGAETLNMAAVAEAKTISLRLQNAIRADGLGTLDKNAQEFLEGMTGGDPSRIGNVEASLNALERSLDTSYKARTKPYMAQFETGAQPVTTAQRD